MMYINKMQIITL